MKMFYAYYSAPMSEWNWLMLFLQIVMHRKRTMLEYLHLRKFATTKMKIRRRRRICLQKWKFLSIHWWWDLLDQTTEVCQLFHLSQSWKKKKNCRSFEIFTLPYIWSCLDIISPNLEKRYLRNVKMKVIWLDQRPIEWFFHPLHLHSCLYHCPCPWINWPP